MHTDESVLQAAAEFDRVMAAGGPDDALLDASPSLDRWEVEPYAGHTRLSGVVYDHPYLPDGHLISTSLLIKMDRRNRWARTLSRWYRLRHPK
ncbi:hypothetical protein KQX63_06900 [Rhodopseudomonas palustris]|uniref:DUF6634 family protein n=1 Tax=Rhodopseudomonas palustris TaxID=1076 RepID=UPI0021F31C81|nr:DUF6634 family protein [Rhodopseudomonas palustris]UYO45736.1 hypothetical protein KQX63_06900 [Rhodopseudomonas palustris]